MWAALLPCVQWTGRDACDEKPQVVSMCACGDGVRPTQSNRSIWPLNNDASTVAIKPKVESPVRFKVGENSKSFQKCTYMHPLWWDNKAIIFVGAVLERTLNQIQLSLGSLVSQGKLFWLEIIFFPLSIYFLLELLYNGSRNKSLPDVLTCTFLHKLTWTG